jgi:AraC-like DNA-binding protein
MAVTLYIPSAPLDAYIKCLWYATDSKPFLRLKMLPVPTLHVMVNLGDTFQVYEPDQDKSFATCADSWSVGLWSSYHIMDVPRDQQIFNVSFKPGGAYPFLQFPLIDLHNQIVSLDAIWGDFAHEIRERLYAAPTLQARFSLLERLLLARLCEIPHELNVVQYAVTEIARSHGSLSIRMLSDQIGISQKHLITQFKKMVGTTPKELARIYRFKHVLSSIDLVQPLNWTLVAHQAYYYDQSHFNKDFAAFTGHSPSDYLRLRRRILTAKPENIQYLDQLPTG